MSNRNQWADVLPVIQALVDGKPIQVKGYSGRWQDTDSMYQVLHSAYRIRPPGITKGVWTQDFTFTEPGRIRGPVGRGTFTWEATDQDTPDFPKRLGYELIGVPKFTKTEFVPEGTEGQP